MKRVFLRLGVLTSLLLCSGCSANEVRLQTDAGARDAMHPAVLVPPTPPKVSVVTAEPATLEEDKAADKSKTAEDKTGAVAVKVDY